MESMAVKRDYWELIRSANEDDDPQAGLALMDLSMNWCYVCEQHFKPGQRLIQIPLCEGLGLHRRHKRCPPVKTRKRRAR